MKRSEVRAFIKSGVDALAQDMSFENGRITEFNSSRDNEYPFVWLESLSVASDNPGTGSPTDNWDVAIHIAKKDAAGSAPEEYEAIIDECDEIARELLHKYNYTLETSVNVSLTAYNRDPFIHKHADDTTGVILSFSLETWDNSSFCL